MCKPAPYASTYATWPAYSEEEARIVHDVLLSNRVNYWTGEQGKTFEKAFAEFAGTQFGIAVANGTLALELAMRALNIQVGDEVIVPARTFMATASAVAVLGAVPVFADVDPDTQNICAKSVKQKISAKTKAVICVHLAGIPCDMDALLDIRDACNIALIEDCAQAHGAKYKGRSVGSFGDVAAWSFCQDKIMTTGGEGGMVTTDSEVLFHKMWSFKDHGKSFDTVFNKTHAPGFRWLHESIGSNYRLSEMQAALGNYQLAKVDAWVARRSEIAQAYQAVLSRSSFIRYFSPSPHMQASYYRFYACWQHPSVSRETFLEQCKAQGLPVDQGVCPEVYMEKAFEGSPSRPEVSLPVAKKLGEQSLMFLTHPNLSDDEVSDICKKLSDILEVYNTL